MKFAKKSFGLQNNALVLNNDCFTTSNCFRLKQEITGNWFSEFFCMFFC